MCYMCTQAEQVADGVWDPKGFRVSVARLADAVRTAAMLNPDKIYERPKGSGCLYTHDGEDGQKIPGCIVGQGIFDITGKVVDQSTLRGSVNNERWMKALNAGIDDVDDFGDVILKDSLTRYLAKWLRVVQAQQDDGQKWGDSVAYADRTVRFSTYSD